MAALAAARQWRIAAGLRRPRIDICTRGLAGKAGTYDPEVDEIEHNEAEAKKWKKIMYVGIVVCLVYGSNVLAHEEHQHQTKEMPYMHVRKKDFPWGSENLFEHWGYK